MRKKRIAFQGEPGAYGEEAIERYFGPSPQTVPCRTFAEVFARLSQGEAEAAVIPIENSITGVIAEVQELLAKQPVRILDSVSLRIEHCLLGNPGSSLEAIRHVYSHPQALMQCRDFLEQLGVQVHAFYDTAGAAKQIQAVGDLDRAAIAGERVARLYGLIILREGISSQPDNTTRFLVIAPRLAARP